MVHLTWMGRTFILDGRETAPSASTPDQFVGPDSRPLPFADARRHGTAVSIPGTLLNVATALERAATRSLAETLGLPIDVAENGLSVRAFGHGPAGAPTLLGSV